ncbi:MAG: hypothetical protein KKG47_09380 [Proteobacteria bacterium]|nr:hypothetical protein [Pseudomonadota bacterium]MBU1736828.1 hypothetical protein [Pseudomonadota bacterium]
MKLVKPKSGREQTDAIKHLAGEVSEKDTERFFQVTSTELSDRQKNNITTPKATYPRQRAIMAVHWHPEFVPLDLVSRRISALYPNIEEQLIIPTQHNQIMAYGDYSGVEVDCYSKGFERKVQLLLHFENKKVEHASVLKSLLTYTFRYRSSQLFEFIHTITSPVEERLEQAATTTGASPEIISFIRTVVGKVEKLLKKHQDDLEPASLKNKLLRNYVDTYRSEFGHDFINRAQNFLQAVKMTVKENFPLTYFYRTSEVIEEARSLGAGIVIPHPEQFWPILLADYDVDGYEVWNPQSSEYTDFLISVVTRRNKQPGLSHKKLLIFMGDDTHMGEVLKDASEQDPAKASREIGFQPLWEDPEIRKKLIKADMQRPRIIKEYKARLA